jgi:hypothetical protein
VSPSWREQVTITLSPQQVTLRRLSRGLRPAIKDFKTLACAQAKDIAGWQPAVEALREALAHPNVESAEVTVVLSNHFVRYLLLPWNPDLVTGQEELAFARARFQHVFGDAAQKWVLKLAHCRPGCATVASAIERPLLESLAAVIAGSPLRLRSVQPGFMTACNARPRMPAGDAWIVMMEPGRLLLGSLRQGAWQSLRSRSLNGHAVALKEIIEQECLLLGVEPHNERVYLHRIGETVLDMQGLKVERWSPDGPALRAGEVG